LPFLFIDNNMKDQDKTKEQLLEELLALRQQASEVESLKNEHRQIAEELRNTRDELAIRVKVRTAEITKINEDLYKEIIERKRAEEALQSRLEFERLIVGISTDFINIKAEEVDNEINHALQEIGKFVGVDRSYVFMASDDKASIAVDNAYEWCADGVDPQIDKLKGLSAENFPWWSKKIFNLENIYIPRVDDLPPDAKSEKQLFKDQDIQSLIVVPMVYTGALIGFLGFDSVRSEKAWSEEHITLLRIVGDIFANALQHKKIEDQILKKESFLTSIFESIQDGISILDNDFNIIRVNATMEKWYAHAMPLSGKKCYKAYHSRDKICEICPTAKTIEKAEAAYEVVPKEIAGGKRVGWLDLYSFPLFDTKTGKMSGVIEYVRDITDRKNAEDKSERLNKELIKTNSRLKQLALRDLHTGLYNYRYLEEVIEAEFYRARRYAHSLSVVMLDIDYFKSINDVYGLPFGDLVLKQFAQQLKRMVRRYDIVIRFAGEEFIVICPGAERPAALNLAQRILDSLNLYNFGDNKHTVKLKLSIAVISYPEDKIVKGAGLIELARQMLNKIKDDGGNRVYSSSDTENGKAAVTARHEKSAEVNFLKSKLDKLNKQANQSLIESIFAFAKTIEVKDHYTGEHVEKTVSYATEIARALDLPKEDKERIKQAAMLHDLGKVGISENILLKKGKLTRKEFETIKKHPQIGVDIIRPIQFLNAVIPLMLYHHERWDGKGYPSGLKGEDIPIGARIIALADVFQALISDRPYRKAYTKGEATKIIKEGSGTQFDPQIVNVFLKILKKEK